MLSQPFFVQVMRCPAPATPELGVEADDDGPNSLVETSSEAEGGGVGVQVAVAEAESDSEPLSDGDVPAPPPLPRRVRGKAKAKAAPVQQFNSIGPAMLFIIVATAGALWAYDFEQMQGLATEGADEHYGDGDSYVLGLVQGTWEFVSGSEASSSTDEQVFVDLCQVNSAARHGILVYRASRQFEFHTIPSVVLPITPFRMLQQLGDLMVYELRLGQRIGGNPTTVKEVLRSLKHQLQVSTIPFENIVVQYGASLLILDFQVILLVW